jgi:hypothetical protein
MQQGKNSPRKSMQTAARRIDGFGILVVGNFVGSKKPHRCLEGVELKLMWGFYKWFASMAMNA